MEACYSLIMANMKHLPMGLMTGSTPPVTLFLASLEWSLLAKLTVFACFAATAVIYGLQNGKEVIRFGLGSAISLFILVMVGFRNATEVDFRILVWTPVFITASLTTAVNVAPKVVQTLENVMPIRINIGRRAYRTQSDPDVERGQGAFEDYTFVPAGPYRSPSAYQDQLSESEESEGHHSSGESIELNSVAPTTSSIRATIGQINGSPSHETREPSNQIGFHVETPQRSMLADSPPWSYANSVGRYPLPDVCSAATMSSSRQAEISEDMGET